MVVTLLTGREIWSNLSSGTCFALSLHHSYALPCFAMIRRRFLATCDLMRPSLARVMGAIAAHAGGRFVAHGRDLAAGAQALNVEAHKDLLRSGPRPILDSKARRH